MFKNLLFSIVIYFLCPLATSDYIINDNKNGNSGQGLLNLINGTNNKYAGNYNTIDGTGNSITGSQNYVQGNNNVVGNISSSQLLHLQNQMAENIQNRFAGIFTNQPNIENSPLPAPTTQVLNLPQVLDVTLNTSSSYISPEIS